MKIGENLRELFDFYNRLMIKGLAWIVVAESSATLAPGLQSHVGQLQKGSVLTAAYRDCPHLLRHARRC